MTYASIDIGTNTFRLLIADVSSGQGKENISFQEIHSERIITRLGEGLSEDNLLTKEAMKRGIDALRQFSELINKHKAEKILAIATSALRNASNSAEFITSAKNSTGIEIEIISGEKEAALTAAGMGINNEPSTTSLMIDIGGGSTELIFSGQNLPPALLTLELGVVYLAEKFMKNNPPSDTDLKQLEDEISRKLESVMDLLPIPIPEQTILRGTAGTITALAAAVQRLEGYDHKRIHNFKLNMTDVNKMYSELSRVTTAERSRFFPFEPSRLDIIVPGTLILLKLMQITEFDNITVSNYGLLEGILTELHTHGHKFRTNR